MILRALVTWLLIIATEIAHGTLRLLYLVPFVGEHRASQIGVVLGSALVLAIAWLTRRWRAGASAPALLGIGALWVALTVAFEFLFGYYVAGYSLAHLARDFNPLAGRWMVFGLLVMLFAPRIARRAG